MPYKDKKKAAEAKREYYLANKEEHNKRSNLSKKRLQSWYQDIKVGLKCTKCEESHISCLDFHHLDKDSKESTVSYMAASGISKKRILEEIDKCIVLCANCHRKLHHDENHGL